MALNIKNVETHKLAARLAKRLDISMTEAITTALRDKLDAAERETTPQDRLANLLKMANAIAARLNDEQKAFDLDAEIYDERGLPR